MIKNSNILVVGGAGFVGSNLVLKLIDLEAEKITIVDNLMSADRRNVPNHPSVDFIYNTITDDYVLKSIEDKYDYIFHLATYHGNQSSMFDPIADHDNNTLTSLKLFNHIKEFKQLKKVVYASAGCTVAEKTFEDVEATTEDAPVSLYLDSPYQMSKIFGEFYGNYFFKQYNMPFVKARFQNIYGPREILGAGEWRGTPATVWRNVIPSFVYKAINGEALTVENGGIATRDFIFVGDLVDGLVACALKGAPGGVYNLASGRETSILDLANLINNLSDNKDNIDFRPARTWDHSGKRYGSTEKAKIELGFEALTSLEEGIKLTVDWTRQNISLINGCIEQHKHRL